MNKSKKQPENSRERERERKKERVKVVASALIFNKSGKVLAIKLKDIDGTLMYIPPGGRPEIGEPLRDCAIRETKEEVGLDIKIDKVFAILEKEYDDGIWTFIFYKASLIGKSKPKNNEPNEIEKISFVPISKLDHFEDMLFIR